MVRQRRIHCRGFIPGGSHTLSLLGGIYYANFLIVVIEKPQKETMLMFVFGDCDRPPVRR